MSKTQEDLMAAFAGESQANRKYTAFAKAADTEGKPNLAKLFRAAAEGETVHALGELRAAGGVKDSVENLKAAIAGETYEVETMYPGFVADAQADGEKGAEMIMHGALEVEKGHAQAYKAALEEVQKGGDIEAKEYFVCSVCGFLAEGEAPDDCPVCRALKAKFIAIA